MITDPTVNQSSQILPPKKALNKAFRKVKPNRTEIEVFKTNLKLLLDRTNDAESEEFHKNLLIEFLKKTYYDPNHYINTKGRNDLVIHNGNKADSNVGVIIETKKPTNLGEMLSHGRLNTKAFQELVLYYLRERITHKNLELKFLVVTNINEWFIFDANSFEKAFAQNKTLASQFNDFEAGRLAGRTTDFFYKEIAQPAIAQIEHELEYTYFDIRNYEKPLRNANLKDDRKLIALFKLLSPEHLLKLPFKNDSNSLDKQFYGELLHIIGLTETKQGGKKLIERQPEGKRNTGSLLENAIIQLDSVDKISRLSKPSQYGDTYQEQLFSVALTLSITWLNRILFLKLLEAQMRTYHKGDDSYEFLSLERIADFDDLNGLFFQVLARDHAERNAEVKEVFKKVPYLNSSLFEPTELEHTSLFISNLRNDQPLPLYASSVLKDQKGKRRSGELATLEYLFEFLKAYDFSSEGGEDVQEDNKTLINASVLGLIFEKINGYKDGSFFTPGFITMYMCRETIRKAVVQKFNEAKGWNCSSLDDVYDKIEDRTEANQLINSLKVCDPAVGSGHFLVSALNEIIAVKNDLRILEDRHGKRLKEYQVEVVNDELIITDEDGELFEYNPAGRESQRVQEALFHEKQTIIENCLFGVDINPNSVKICRLRLWIELLKNAYYKNETELETLPNIDINIKAGNSLISRFALDADLGKALKKSAWSIESYQSAVNTYRRAESKEQKREMERIIRDIKSDFRSEISANDPKIKRRDKLKGEIFLMNNQTSMFEMSKREKAAWNKKLAKHTADLKKLETQIQEIKDNKIYENAFEWRFEFPEVLNEKGEYVGFDVVIGNPPYGVSLGKKDDLFYRTRFSVANYQLDTYSLFSELGMDLLQKAGTLTFIIPSAWTSSNYGNSFREFLINRTDINEIVVTQKNVFADATVETVIISLDKLIKNDNFRVKRWDSSGESFTMEKEMVRFSSGFSFPIFSNPRELKLVHKMKGLPEQFEDHLDFVWGVKIYQKGKGKPPQSGEESKNKSFHSLQKKKSSHLPLIGGKEINRYSLAAPQGYVDYGEWLAEPRNSDWFATDDKRIVVREVTSKGVIQATIIDFPCVFSNSVDGARIKTNVAPEYFLGILNSKLISFYHSKSSANSFKDTFPKILIKDLKGLPLPEIKKRNIEVIVPLVQKRIQLSDASLKIKNAVLEHLRTDLNITKDTRKINDWPNLKEDSFIKELRKQTDLTSEETTLRNLFLVSKREIQETISEINETDKEIDNVVYQLYGLTEEEIEIIENT